MNITMVIANSAASAPEMMMGNSHSHAYKGKYQGKIIDCVPSMRPFITTDRLRSSNDCVTLCPLYSGCGRTLGLQQPIPTE